VHTTAGWLLAACLPGRKVVRAHHRVGWALAACLPGRKVARALACPGGKQSVVGGRLACSPVSVFRAAHTAWRDKVTPPPALPAPASCTEVGGLVRRGGPGWKSAAGQAPAAAMVLLPAAGSGSGSGSGGSPLGDPPAQCRPWSAAGGPASPPHPARLLARERFPHFAYKVAGQNDPTPRPPGPGLVHRGRWVSERERV